METPNIFRAIRHWTLMPLGLGAFVVVGSGQTFGVPSMLAQTLVTDDTMTKLMTQGGAVAVLLVVLWSYRRDFFRKLEDKEREIREHRDEKQQLQDVIDKSTAAITSAVLATTNQTNATHQLAKTVEAIDRKMDERRHQRGDD